MVQLSEIVITGLPDEEGHGQPLLVSPIHQFTMARGEMDVVDVRPATLEDAAAVRELLIETWHDTYDQIMGHEKVCAIADRWHTLDRLRRQILDPGFTFLVASTQETELIGHVLAGICNREYIEILRLYVRPSFQGQGVGKQLLRRVGTGLSWSLPMILSVEAENRNSISTYHSWGFRVISSLVEDNRPVVRMRRIGSDW